MRPSGGGEACRGDRGADSLGDLNAASEIGVRQDDEELLAAPASRDVSDPKRIVEPEGELA